MVLVFYVQDPADGRPGLNGMPLVQMAVNNSVGPSGASTSSRFAIFMFAYSSLIGNYFYAESNFRFIKNDSKARALIDLPSSACLVGHLLRRGEQLRLWRETWRTSSWASSAAIVNLIAILLLGKWAIKALDA